MRRVLPRDFAWAKNVVAFDPPADHHAKNRQSMRYFVYVLRSTVAERLYIGSSAEPDARLKSDNFGGVRSTKAWRRGSVFYLNNIQTALRLRRERITSNPDGVVMELALLLERWQSG
jgi:hypothetical protein